MWFLVVVAAAQPVGHPPAEGHPCDTSYDCPKAECWEGECVLLVGGSSGAGSCHYTREPITECCLNSDECCEFADEFQTGICDKNCTCRFIPSLQFQCTRDKHCDRFRTAAACRAQGECYLPVCDHGFCECINAEGMDTDGDGVFCPEDCDDTDPNVSKEVTCFPDADKDQWPSCPEPMPVRRKPLPGECRTFCVEPDFTCPKGWTDPLDPFRFLCPPSRKADQGSTCEGEPPPESCDCCDIDPHAFPGSQHASNTPNACGDEDFNCDGQSTRLACCLEGRRPFDDDDDDDSSSSSSSSSSSWSWPRSSSSPSSSSSLFTSHSSSSDRTKHGHGNGQFLWYEQQCMAVNGDECGGCSTVAEQPVFVTGWACEEDCLSGVLALTKKRSWVDDYLPNGCPTPCGGECECVDGQTPPRLGECAKRVIGCLEVEPGLFSDEEDCCIVTVL